MNRAARRSKNKKGNAEQPGWAQKGKFAQQARASGKTSVNRGRFRVSQERGGGKA